MSSIAINGFTLTHQALHATQETGISPIERLVLGTLAGFCNFLSECWPSNSTLADRTGLHERTVRRQLESLQAKGLIERHSRGQGRAMLTRLLITPQGRTTDTPPTTTGTPPPHEPTRNLKPNTAHEPPQQQATAPAAMPLLFVSQIQEQPIPALPDLEHPPITSISTNEAIYKPVEATETSQSTNPPTDTPTPAVEHQATNTEHQAEAPATQGQASEADQAVAALASLPETLLADMALIRVSKKRPAKITKTEAVMWWQEAQKAGWDMQTVITTMICHGWARFQASWVQNLPAHVQPGTPGRDQVFVPEVFQPASASAITRFKESWAKQRAQILADSARRREEQMGRPSRP